jgi:hypothetical protein
MVHELIAPLTAHSEENIGELINSIISNIAPLMAVDFIFIYMLFLGIANLSSYHLHIQCLQKLIEV